ncbi:MAG: hypothetical protein HQ546_04865 [Planctomycetes bacterium]|nr:hypothetical protein [Planctomycetota bacterium]
MARADISYATNPLHRVVLRACPQDGQNDLCEAETSTVFDLAAGVPVGNSAFSDPPTHARVEIELSDTPSSAMFFLWALGTFGVSRLGRSAKYLYQGQLPEWFHTGGPSQIGHATVFEMNFVHLPAFCSCCVDEPMKTAARWRLQVSQYILSYQQFHIVLAAAPRSPPA